MTQNDTGGWPNESETQQPLPAGIVKDDTHTILKIDPNLRSCNILDETQQKDNPQYHTL